MYDPGTPSEATEPTYTTAAKVAAKLQIDAFSSGTIPTEAQVKVMIRQCESEIERHARMAWRTMAVADELCTMQNLDSYSILTSPPYIKLANKFVKTFSSTSDKLEVYTNGSWVDWLDTKVEGRGNDFWVDYREGIVYFNRGFPLFHYSEGIRVTYRHGKATVDGWVERLATLMAAIEVAENNTDRLLHAGGGSSQPDKPSQDSVIRMMQAKVDKILDEKPWLIDTQSGIVL